MKPRQWWKNTIIYEVYVDKFAGNFKGLADKLEYLKELGVDCIWLLPHYPSPMIDGGYDVSDYLNIRKDLGTLEDFDHFSQKAKSLGIRVMIDLVLNHISIEHQWFKDGSSSKHNQYRDFFLWSKTGKEFPEATNPFFHLKPSNWIYHKESSEYYFATFYPQQADLNWDNPRVFDAAMEIVDFWIARGVSGFRLDAAPFLIKREDTNCTNLPETHHVIKKIRAHIDSRHEDIVLLAEANGPLSEIKEFFGDGDECHLAFHFHLMSALFLAFKRDDKTIINEMIEKSFNIPDNCQWVTFLRNHDELTLSHIPSEEREELLSWLNKEHVYGFEGGYGVSKRVASVFNGDKKKIIEAYKTLFDSPGSPVIYYGDELGMENTKLSYRARDTRRYVRGKFSWREAKKQMRDPDSLFKHVKEMISERKTGRAPLPVPAQPQPTSPFPIPETNIMSPELTS